MEAAAQPGSVEEQPVIPVSSRPRKSPGKASTLLIWLKSERPVATTAAWSAARSVDLGDRVGHGETMAPSFMTARSRARAGCPMITMKTSAPLRPSLGIGHLTRIGVLREPRCSFMPSVSLRTGPRYAVAHDMLGGTGHERAMSRLAMALPAAPTPDRTMRVAILLPDLQGVDEGGRGVRDNAVPCWS